MRCAARRCRFQPARIGRRARARDTGIIAMLPTMMRAPTHAPRRRRNGGDEESTHVSAAVLAQPAFRGDVSVSALGRRRDGWRRCAGRPRPSSVLSPSPTRYAVRSRCCCSAPRSSGPPDGCGPMSCLPASPAVRVGWRGPSGVASRGAPQGRGVSGASLASSLSRTARSPTPSAPKARQGRGGAAPANPDWGQSPKRGFPGRRRKRPHEAGHWALDQQCCQWRHLAWRRAEV